MTPEERESTNKFLHEQILNLCYHYEIDQGTECEVCHKFVSTSLLLLQPDYCADLNEVSKVEQQVIEKVGAEKYGYALAKEIGGQFYHIGVGMDKFYVEFVTEAATASAEQRAQASKKAWEAQA